MACQWIAGVENQELGQVPQEQNQLVCKMICIDLSGSSLATALKCIQVEVVDPRTIA